MYTSDIMGEPLLPLDEGETVGIYRVLRSLEGSGALSPDLLRLLRRIEKLLYERLTIQELEGLEQNVPATDNRSREERKR